MTMSNFIMNGQMFLRSCARLIGNNCIVNSSNRAVVISQTLLIPRHHHTTNSLMSETPQQDQPSSSSSTSDVNVQESKPQFPRRREGKHVEDFPGYVIPYNAETEKMVDQLLDEVQDDMPLPDMPDPFEKNYKRCFLCRQDVQLDHKNVRLLSQFVSPYTGRIYGRAVTGLCIPMQRNVSRLIKRARYTGYMPYIIKDTKYLADPLPYDPMARK